MTTYQTLIRDYAGHVRTGTADTDLTPRQRRLTAVALATASNAGWSAVAYPPTDQTRDDVIRDMGRAFWDGNAHALMLAVSPATDDDFTIAVERAAEVLRNL